MVGSSNLGKRTILLEPGSLVAIQGCVARTLMTTLVSWYAQELVLLLQNRLSEERWWWRRGRQGTASPSPAGKAASEARRRILGAGDWPGGGSCPEQVLSSSQWGISGCALACPVEWNLLAKYSLLRPTQPLWFGWLVFVVVLRWVLSDWVSQAGTHCVAQAIVLFCFFYLVYFERRLLIAPNGLCFKKKKSSPKEGSQALWFISQGSLTNVDVQDKFNKKNLMFR